MVDETRFVAFASREKSKKYRMFTLSFQADKLKLVRHVDGEGFRSTPSPLFDNAFTLVGSDRNMWVEMWNVHTDTIVRGFKRGNKNKQWTKAAVVGRHGEYVVAGDNDRVLIWNKETGDYMNKFSGHKDRVRGVSANPINPLEFVSFSEDKSFIVWTLAMDERVPGFISNEPEKSVAQQMEALRKEIQSIKDMLQKQNNAFDQQLAAAVNAFDEQAIECERACYMACSHVVVDGREAQHAEHQHIDQT
jgi:hypothetical protein